MSYARVVRRAAIALVATLALTGLAHAQKVADIKKAGVLKIGAQVAQVPFGFTDKAGKLTGFDIEFAEMLAKDLGVKPEFTPVTVANRTAALLTGQVDMLAAVVTVLADRQKAVLFSRPYCYNEVVLIGKADLPAMKTFEDTKKYRIGVPRGSTQDASVTQAKAGSVIQRFDDDAAAVQALLSNQVDLVGASNTQLPNIEQVAGAGKYSIKLVLTRNYQSVAVRPGEQEWVGYINDFIERKTKSGELGAMFKKWFQAEMKALPTAGMTEAALPVVVTK
jgi:polar amino acid transport system substrate-binding protein